MSCSRSSLLLVSVLWIGEGIAIAAGEMGPPSFQDEMGPPRRDGATQLSRRDGATQTRWGHPAFTRDREPVAHSHQPIPILESQIVGGPCRSRNLASCGQINRSKPLIST